MIFQSVLTWGRRRPVWFSSKIILFSSSVWAVPNVDVLKSWSPEILTVPSATGNMKMSPFIGVKTSFALRLRAWSSDVSVCSNSSMSATIESHFQILPADNTYPKNTPGNTLWPNWCCLDRSFADIGWYSTTAPNGITGPVIGIPSRLS